MRGVIRDWARFSFSSAWLILLAGCSTASSGAAASTAPTCEAYESDADLSSPTISFAQVVAPIFTKNCTINDGTCHSAGNASPYLGEPDGGADAETILDSIVGMDADEDPDMNYVTPMMPEQSYLMHKMDGDQCTLAAQCAMSPYNAQYPNCGQSMPFLPHVLLSPSVRNSIRAWIFQGAQND